MTSGGGHQGRIQDFPLGGGGAPTLIGGGANLRHRHFLVKTYVKTKEFGPVGGGGAPETFVCRSATGHVLMHWQLSLIFDRSVTSTLSGSLLFPCPSQDVQYMICTK